MSSGRAQSEIIGVILLVGVVVTLVFIGGAAAFTTFSDGTDRLFVDVDATATTQNVTLSHGAGDNVPTDDLTVILRAGDTERYDFASFTQLSGNDGTQFEQGDTWYRGHGLDGDRMEILLVHEPSNSILDRTTVNIEETLAARIDTSPSNPTTLSTIEFNASSSVAKDSEITSYAWELGDGTSDSGEVVTHSYDDAGTYDITLTVDTADGRTTSTTTQVDVANPTPTAAFTFNPTSPDKGEETTFDGSGSEAPGSTIDTYEWDFDGDGTTDQTGEVVTTSFGSDGSYDVTLTVTDQEGETAATTRTVTVETTEPDIRIFNARPDGNDVAKFDVENTQDSTITLTGIVLNGTSSDATKVSKPGNKKDELVFTNGGALDAGKSGINIDGTKYTLDTSESIGSGASTTGTLERFDENIADETLTMTLYYEIDGQQAKQTQTLKVDSSPYFNVDITDTNSPITEEETVTVTYNVTNIGTVSGTQNVGLTFDGADEGGEEIDLDVGESETGEFEYELEGDDSPGEYAVTVSTDNESASTTVDVIGKDTPFLDVNITDTNDPLVEGETLTVTADITNAGDEDANNKAITLDVEDTGETDTTTVSIEAEETKTVTLEWTTGDGDAGEYDVTVDSGDDTDTGTVQVAAEEGFVSLETVVLTDKNGKIEGAEITQFKVTDSSEITFTATESKKGDSDSETVGTNGGVTSGGPITLTIGNKGRYEYPVTVRAEITGGECLETDLNGEGASSSLDNGDWQTC